MKKRMLSIVLALVMVCSLMPLSTVVYAEDLYVELDTVSSSNTYTSGPITITGMFCNGAGMWCDQCSGMETVTISVSDGYVIKTVEALVGMKVPAGNPDLAVDHGTLSAPSKEVGSTIRIENVDAPSVTISNTDDYGWTLNHFKVYYGPAHAHSYAANYSFDSVNHWKECTAEGATEDCLEKENHTWVRSADGATTSCATCGAYVTVTATSGVTPKTVKDCVTIETNLPDTPVFVVMDTSKTPAKEVALTTSVEGNYQAIAQVATGVNPYADFTLTNPTTTAATGDNRPIELLVVGFAAMAAMAAAAFTVDRKRR